MPALPVYQVDFILVERRLSDRRVVLQDAKPGVDKSHNRRTTLSRRSEDCRTGYLKAV